jgi:distribution and morphology protein 34
MSVSDDSALTESSGPPSIYSAPLPVVNEQSDDPVTPPLSPETDSHLPVIPDRYRTTISRPALRRSTLTLDNEDPSYSVETIRPSKIEDVEATPRATVRGVYPDEKAEAGSSSGTPRPSLPATILPFTKEDRPTGESVDSLLVERLAGEIARRMREEKLMTNNACSNFWSRAPDDAPPPAYGH